MSSTVTSTIPEQAGLAFTSHNPDVLTCIANLSNDEVFTPPVFANRMLDVLAVGWAEANDGADIWADSSVTFLDPFTKSGVFLREITRRLTDGLAGEIPDLAERVDHILTKQVYGIGITQLTALLARRSLYCSKLANGEHSIARSFGEGSGFGCSDGHVWFERTEHEWGAKDKCRFCGASKEALERGPGLESHAYAFIHTDDIKARMAELFGANMQFDVIVGNPPYQLDDGGHGTSAAPIYHHFVEKSKMLDPRFIVMVTPSRWMAGGKGLDTYRKTMLADRRMRNIVDYPKLFEAFPGVKIRGGISYFLWERNHNGPCEIVTVQDGQQTAPPSSRFLDEYDVLVRRNEAVPILKKVRAKHEPTLDEKVSTGKPFGLRTFFHGKSEPEGIKNPIKLFGSQKISWVDRADIAVNDAWIDDWKVLMTAVQGTSAAVETQFLSKPIVAPAKTACTETYLVAGRFGSEVEAQRYAMYLATRFVRFLVSLRKSTQHATRDVYAFVPDLPMDRVWTDDDLRERYGITDEEWAFVEKMVRPMELDA